MTPLLGPHLGEVQALATTSRRRHKQQQQQQHATRSSSGALIESFEWGPCRSRRQAVLCPALATPTTQVVPPPTVDYMTRLRARQSDPTAAPFLMLAPMENLADTAFRVSHTRTLGGADECCTEFLRVPDKANKPLAVVRGVCAPYNAWELQSSDTPLAAQIMGSNPELLGLAAHHLATVKLAPRVDLNCGCPANTVTGNGAGSSLLRTPDVLHQCVRAMVQAAGQHTTVSVKMRAGYDDTSLFEQNLLAAQEAGAAFVTLHARTKRQTYEGLADWKLIARAKQLLRIPVVGNGDVVSPQACQRMVQETNCDGIMIGRGAVQDPLLFWRIRASYELGLPWQWNEPAVIQAFLRAYAAEAFKPHRKKAPAPPTAVVYNCSEGHLQPVSGPGDCLQESEEGASNSRGNMEASLHKITERGKFGRIKKVLKYLFNSSPQLAEACDHILRIPPGTGVTADELVELCCQQIARCWPATGPSRLVLVNHMTKAETVVLAG